MVCTTMSAPLETRAVAPTPLPAQGEWFVLHTRSRQEKVLAADLGAMGVDFFLPLISHTRLSGRQRVTSRLPLFPGYVFLRGTREQAFAADRTRRVASIIPVPDQSKLDWELRNLHMALAFQVPLDPYPYLREGVRVEVRTGPLRGLQGVVESRKHLERIILKVDMLGRALSIELDGHVLEPIS
jgi:transcriptional antiterminator RfaH